LDQAIEAICKDLGIRPQYELWEGLDWPPWRQNQPPSEPELEPEPAPSSPPLSGGEPAGGPAGEPASEPPGEPESEDALATVGTRPWPPP
jgi:hypothetical protein